jgi:hypothetical protein
MLKTIALPFGLAVAAATGPAAAPPVCLARAMLVQQLQADFGEFLLWQGSPAAEPGNESMLLEIFVGPNGGSWTLVHSLPPSPQNPGGLSCLVSAGQRWTPGLAAPAPEGRKS